MSTISELPEQITTTDLIVQEMPRLRRYARKLVADTDRADDLVDDCVVRALGRLDSLLTISEYFISLLLKGAPTRTPPTG